MPPILNSARISPPLKARLSLEGLEAREVPNVAPVFAATTDRFVAPGQQFYGQVFATDADRDWVTYSAVGLPMGLGIDATTGTVAGVVPIGQYQANQQFLVTFTAGDGNGGATNLQATFTITGAPNMWTVNTTNDTADLNLNDGVPLDGNNKVSLRAAIQQANFNRQTSNVPIFIAFDPMVFLGQQTINLQSKMDPITADLTISGTGKDSLFITGAGTLGMFQIGIKDTARAAVAVVISGLTLQNGNNIYAQGQNGQPGNDGFGGAVENYWATFLNGVQVRGSSATLGGGAYNHSLASLTITNSTIIDNHGLKDPGGNQGYGGGVGITGGHVTIVGSTIKDNTSETRGGGIGLNNQGKGFLLNTDLIHNTAQNGGGVYVSGGCWFQMSMGKMESNEATALGGGIVNETTALLTGVTFDKNKADKGGAVCAHGGFTILTTCTFGANNQATTGGAKVAKQAGATFTATGCGGFDPVTEIYVYNN